MVRRHLGGLDHRVGVGYPPAALLAELGGVRAAYGLGLFVTAAALLTAWRSMPEGRFTHVDVAGAVVLAAALLLVLFLAGERNLWSRHLAVVAVVMLCVWAVIELRSTTPLVDVRAVRAPGRQRRRGRRRVPRIKLRWEACHH
ncbi:hypothetical protein ACIBG4_32890 [Nonomuraea sp. NPDC050383]|uniref:hypothetical protein n=1 Tax=Nonomuraea sp. NPDC050383 TaxID=3364362 RepID=UPI00378EF7CD